ncbi:MAG: thiolase family protein [Ignavibacteria bacterium]|nr:thiolase family protein [Ignavibacteria bacterium]MCC7158088.1 thiolase family protein [Ignavibacteria bacterium]
MKSYHNKEKGIGILFDDIYLAGGARTPFGKFCGTLARVSPTDLGIFASKGALEKTGVSAGDIDQVVIANIGQACPDAYFLPRHIALFSGVPITVPTLMVQRICASGLETIISASEQISLGKADSVLCCGTENMSLAPTVSFGNRLGYQLGKIDFQDMLWVALDDTAAGYPMGETAENLAKRYNILRSEVDEYAKISCDRALAAKQSGVFTGEITILNSTVFETEGLKPRKVKLPKGVIDFNLDENIRSTTLESLQKLPSAFIKDGIQSAGNSSGIVDGAAAAIVGSKSFIEGKSLKPIAKIIGSSACGVDPKYMGIGPVPAIKIILEMTGLKLDDIDLFEINEAFGAQLVACERELKLDRNKLNVNGGAIAIGHPLGATGVRLSLTISRELIARKAKYGIASACVGGGQGTAILYENINL